MLFRLPGRHAAPVAARLPSSKRIATAFPAPGIVTSRACSAGVKAEAGEARAPVFKYVGRSREVNALAELRGEPPVAVQAVLGEDQCGKSTVFSYACEDPKHPGIYIDLRRVRPSDSEALLQAVLEQCEKFSLRLGSAGRFAQFMPWLAPVLNLPWAISVDFNKAQSAGKMGQALIVLDMVVKLYYDKKGPNAPPLAIVFDHAEVWQHWESSEDIWLLSQWMIQVTKVKHQVHVFVLTSKYGFVDFLRREVATRNVMSLVLGNFSAADADEYMEYLAGQRGYPVSDDHKVKISEVCLGNAGLMNKLTSLYPQTLDWQQALTRLVEEVSLPAIEVALDPGNDNLERGYTSQQFAAVAQQLVVKDGVIGAEEVSRLVGAGPLAAMVRDNLLSVRLSSVLAPHDIIEERWCAMTGTQMREQRIVVPAVSSHLAAMKQRQELIRRVAATGLLRQHR